MTNIKNKTNHFIAMFGCFSLIHVSNNLIIKQILTTIIPVQNSQDIQKSRFPGTGRTHYRNHFTFINLKINIAQHLKLMRTHLIGFVNVF